MTLRRSLTANHEPTKGKEREVYIAVREKGQTVNPVDQILFLAGGFQAELTVGTVGAGNYSVTVAGETVTVAAAGTETATQIKNLLVAALVARDVIRKTGVAAWSSGTATFKLGRSTTFTVAVSSPSNSLTISTAVASVAGSADKGDDSLTLAFATAGQIIGNQYLTFCDGDGQERVVKVTAKAVAGVTTLAVDDLPEGIAGGSFAEYPPYLWDRTGADISRSYTNSSSATFNTGNNADGTPSGSEKSISLPGLEHYANAAYRTALLAADNEQYIHCRVVDPPPNSNFSKGKVIEGRALVTGANSTAPADGDMTADLEIIWRGAVTESDPVPVA